MGGKTHAAERRPADAQQAEDLWDMPWAASA
jgi:hypothetical protein